MTNEVLYVGRSVRDARRSARWYRELFGMETIRQNYASSNWESDRDEVLLRHPVSGPLLGLLQHPANPGEPFSEFRTGLDPWSSRWPGAMSSNIARNGSPRGEHDDRHRHHQRPHHRRPRPAGASRPAGHPDLAHVGSTRGVDWIEPLIQIALAALGVALVAGMYAPGRRRT